ncbi:Azaphilone cluster-specific transcription factorazaR [Ceratocystis lukuohia]|uniref:Azaphilone cluster-specific transcription factorazaR n=1 Tax=Ceratocystis lukuohia TaxID=2019550 RepID=A0ABR4MDJ5_9PEZI
MCLQYAIWANASHDHPKYSHYHRFFYERARQYAERDELKGEGEYFLTLGHAQAWVLIATEEARSLQFSRAAMSSARCTRLVQMMGLHRMDVEQEWAVPVLGPASSWIETEERRRTFWSAYCIDSHASLATGWPSLINNDDIGTRLPSSEEAFTSGQEEQTCTLKEALTGHSYSTFAGAVMISHLFSIVLRHVQRPPPGDNPNDINGPFWKRHQQLNKTIGDVFMYLPPQLRLPDNIKDPSAIHTNLHLHASYICLHHQAVDKAIDFGLDSFKAVSEQTLFSSASSIVSLMQGTSHVTSASNYKSPLIALSMFCAASVYVYHLRDSAPTPLHAKDMENLNYLLTTMQGLASKHIITRSFLQQICSEIERHGLRTYIHHPAVEKFAFEGTSASIPLVSRGRKLYPRDRNKHVDRRTMPAQLLSGFTPLECDYIEREDVVELSENKNPKYNSNIPQRAQGSVVELSSPTSSKSQMSPLLIPTSRHGIPQQQQQQQQMPQQYLNAVHDSYVTSSSVPSLSTPSSSATPPDTWKYRRPGPTTSTNPPLSDPLGTGHHCASVPATVAADPAFPVSLPCQSVVEMTPRQQTSTHAMQGEQQQLALNPMPRGWSATQQYIPVFLTMENNDGRMAPPLEQPGHVPVSVTGWDMISQVVMQGSERWPNNEPQS